MDLFDNQIQQMAQEQKTKKQYIQDYVVAYGYDQEDFNDYLGYQKENGADLTNWTVDELSQCIRDYYVYIDPNYGQHVDQ